MCDLVAVLIATSSFFPLKNHAWLLVNITKALRPPQSLGMQVFPIMATMPKCVSHFSMLSSFLCICGPCQLKHAYCCSNQVSTYFQQSKNLEPSCNQFFGNAHCIEKIPALWAGTSPLRRCAPAHQACISPVNRLTCSPSWYQPGEQVNLLTKLVAAQRAG
jgi:hypothetical protein